MAATRRLREVEASPNAFCKVDGINGDCAVEGFEKYIEVYHWELLFEQPTSPTKSGRGGITTSESKHHPLAIAKEMDGATTHLMDYLDSGKHIPKVELVLCERANNSFVPYGKIELTDAVITSLQCIHDITGDGRPEEEVRFTYTGYKFTYTESDNKGNTKGSKAAGWDQYKAKKMA